MIPINKDLEKDGLELLLYQFGDKPNINAFLSTFLADLEQLNNDTFDLVNGFNIDNATGIYLDYVGNLVGEYRNEESDEPYRRRIRIKILINNSKGTPNEILEILSVITETQNVRLWEHYPVFSMLYTDGNSGTIQTLNSIRQASPITSESSLMVDTTRRGWVGSEFYKQIAFLVDDANNNIANENGDLFVVQSEGGILPSSAPVGKNSTLSEILDQASFIVNEANNNIVDENNNMFIGFSSGGDVFSNDGIFNELIP